MADKLGRSRPPTSGTQAFEILHRPHGHNRHSAPHDAARGGLLNRHWPAARAVATDIAHYGAMLERSPAAIWCCRSHHDLTMHKAAYLQLKSAILAATATCPMKTRAAPR
jgi:hypothetical protein